MPTISFESTGILRCNFGPWRCWAWQAQAKQPSPKNLPQSPILSSTASRCRAVAGRYNSCVNSPCLLRTGIGTEARREFCDRVYVATLFDVIVQADTSRPQGVVFDQGPLFRLARMCASRHTRWWSEAIHRWSQTLDLVVWLDAPEELLLERVRTRSKQHRIKSVSHARALRRLSDQRAQYRDVLDELRDLGDVPILRLDTSNYPIESCVEQIRSACNVKIA